MGVGERFARLAYPFFQDREILLEQHDVGRADDGVDRIRETGLEGRVEPGMKQYALTLGT